MSTAGAAVRRQASPAGLSSPRTQRTLAVQKFIPRLPDERRNSGRDSPALSDQRTPVPRRVPHPEEI